MSDKDKMAKYRTEIQQVSSRIFTSFFPNSSLGLFRAKHCDPGKSSRPSHSLPPLVVYVSTFRSLSSLPVQARGLHICLLQHLSYHFFTLHRYPTLQILLTWEPCSSHVTATTIPPLLSSLTSTNPYISRPHPIPSQPLSLSSRFSVSKLLP